MQMYATMSRSIAPENPRNIIGYRVDVLKADATGSFGSLATCCKLVQMDVILLTIKFGWVNQLM